MIGPTSRPSSLATRRLRVRAQSRGHSSRTRSRGHCGRTRMTSRRYSSVSSPCRRQLATNENRFAVALAWSSLPQNSQFFRKRCCARRRRARASALRARDCGFACACPCVSNATRRTTPIHPTVTVKSLTGARAAAASRSHVARCGGCPLLIDDHASANAGDGPRNLRRLANEQAERSEINSLALKHRC